MLFYMVEYGLHSGHGHALSIAQPRNSMSLAGVGSTLMWTSELTKERSIVPRDAGQSETDCIQFVLFLNSRNFQPIFKLFLD